MAVGAKKRFEEHQLSNWRLLESFRNKLSLVLQRRNLISEADSKRKLVVEQYFSLVLFSLFNPVADTMRGLCHASRMGRVQGAVAGGPVSLGSFSEAQHVFDPGLLNEVLRELIRDRPDVFGDERVKKYVTELTSTDATLWRMLPRVAWAMFDYRGNQSIRFHLQYDVFKQIPSDWEITEAAVCERKVFKKHIKKGSFHVADRYYGHDYKLIGQMLELGASFALRLFNSAHFVEIGEPRQLTAADHRENVVKDVDVRLGKNGDGPLVRLVTIRANGHLFLIITDRRDIPAELISLIYKYRWQIELFFKWVKCILKCRHFIAESRNGVAIQIYCALIAAVMLTGIKNKRPTKREMESLRFYFMGYATDEELLSFLKLEA